MNITKHSKEWWNDSCWRNLETYRQSKQLEDWKGFKRMVKKTKQNFFDRKIDKITNKKCRPWELMNWVKKKSLLATKAVQYNSWPYIELDDL